MATRPHLPGGPSASATEIRVEVTKGPRTGLLRELPGDEPFSIGASRDNAFVIEDGTVSRYHLEVSRVEGGIRVRDLGSLNGVSVGRVRVQDAVLPPGTKLRLGRTEIVLTDGEERPTGVYGDGHDLGLIGQSAAMARVADRIRKVGPKDVSVLIEGETGTGKEVVARALHRASPRANQPLVVVDCGALAPTLIASELFGHERGAFTGAVTERKGAFERAHGGTLLLDEIGELPLDLQPTLLGVLERRCFHRVGGTEPLEVNVRVLAATHRDLRGAANRGAFRADLYFRLAVVRLRVPPLRERPDDIAPLIRHFVREVTGQPESDLFDSRALDALRRQRLRGNVRELRNLVESTLALGYFDERSDGAGATDGAWSPAASYREAREAAVFAFEERFLSSLMREAEGNASKAARIAKMDRPYLLSLLKKHGMR